MKSNHSKRLKTRMAETIFVISPDSVSNNHWIKGVPCFIASEYISKKSIANAPKKKKQYRTLLWYIENIGTQFDMSFGNLFSMFQNKTWQEDDLFFIISVCSVSLLKTLHMCLYLSFLDFFLKCLFFLVLYCKTKCWWLREKWRSQCCPERIPKRISFPTYHSFSWSSKW